MNIIVSTILGKVENIEAWSMVGGEQIQLDDTLLILEIVNNNYENKFFVLKQLKAHLAWAAMTEGYQPSDTPWFESVSPTPEIDALTF